MLLRCCLFVLGHRRDAEGAKKTQEEFVRTGIIVSQVNSLVHSVAGKEEEARKIQMEFLKNAETIVDGIPVVGHVKGAIHVLAGDEERGEQILNGTL
jgi:hypothetical protein